MKISGEEKAYRYAMSSSVKRNLIVSTKTEGILAVSVLLCNN
jgi:hypothetical protein